MAERFDIAVIGGGPAGCSAAITAARTGARVLLLEKGLYPRHKVCGEFVSEESHTLLADLLKSSGKGRFLDTSLVISQARSFVDGKVISHRVDPPAQSISRSVMDHALWQATECQGVAALQKSYVRNIAQNGDFVVATDSGELYARAVILAAGRWSNLGPRAAIPRSPKWIGIKAHFRESSPPPSCDLYFFSGGYCGVQPVEADTINVAAMVRTDVATSMEDVLRCELNLETRSRYWKQLTETITTAPLLLNQPIPRIGNMLHVGDAAGFIDPFAGDGISLALQSGALAARVLAPYLRGEQSLMEAASAYESRYRSAFLTAFRNAAHIRNLLAMPRLVRSAAILAMQLPAIADYAVRITRARTAVVTE